MKQIFTGIMLASILLVSCRSAKKNKSESKSIDTVTISAFNNPMNLYRATAPREWNILHTRVALSFNYEERTAQGQEWISLQPYCYPSDTLTLDAKGMKIESVTVGHSDKVLQYTYDSSQLRIRLDKMYSSNEQVRLTIKYVAMPYKRSSMGSTAISDDRGLYFINTDGRTEGKPVQIWTQGETESNSNWLPTIDKPNMRTTVQLELTVPGQYKTLSNGALISSMEHGVMRTDIWKTEQPIQVYAIMFAIGDFRIARDQWKNKAVDYYVEPAYEPYARNMFRNTPEMIDFFSNITGVPYPWNKYSQIVVRDYVSGAMENTSASLFGEFMNLDNREYADMNHEDVVSHELFHQWFGDYVTAESWSHLTVNESFATYGEYLWRRHKYGAAYADELAWNDLQRYLNYTSYSDPMLVRHYYRDKEEMFDRVSYQKGGAILHYLHELTGDTAFYRSMHYYLSNNALESAEATHWRLAVEAVTGKDWNWFFNQWYYRAGHPELDIHYQYDAVTQKLNVTVKQVQSDKVGLYTLPLKALIISGKEQKTEEWVIRKAKETFTYDYKNGIPPVIVPDVAHVLPGTITEHKTYAQWLVQLTAATDFVSQLLAVEQVKELDLGQKEVQAILSTGLDNKIAAIREAALRKIKTTGNEELRGKWKSGIVFLAGNDGNNSVRALAIEILGHWKAKDQKQLMLDGLNDSSYLVAGNSLLALKSIDDSLAYQLAKKYCKGKPDTHLDTKAWDIIASKASVADTALLSLYALKTNDADQRKHMFNDLATFAMKVQDETAFALSVKLLARKIGQTESKSKRSYYAGFLLAVRENLNTKEKKTGLYQFKLKKINDIAKELNGSEKEKEVQKVYEAMLK